jgi:hypothetical protein
LASAQSIDLNTTLLGLEDTILLDALNVGVAVENLSGHGGDFRELDSIKGIRLVYS